MSQTSRFQRLRHVVQLAICLLGGAPVVWLFAFFGSPTADVRRHVIISTDDAGMCTSVNEGTVAALQAGGVRSVSVMTCCPAFDEFAKFARSHPEFDYGVHLTLTCDLRREGWGPVLNRAEVPSLVDKDGHLHSTTPEVARLASLSEAEAELRAQIHKAIDSGIRISHLDHHMWVLYGRPDLLRLYVQLGKEFGIPIRFSRDVPRQVLSSGIEEVVSAYKEQSAVLEQAGFPLLDRIEADNYPVAPLDKRLYFLTNLRDLRPGLTEIVIHCGGPKGSVVEPPDAENRVADTVVFSSRELREELLRLRIEVLDWRDLRILQR